MTQPQRYIPVTLALSALIALSACTAPMVPSTQEAPGRLSARFDEFPAELFLNYIARCQGDAERLTRVTDQALSCEALPPPEIAATLILRFDGDVQEIPTFVTMLSALDTDAGAQVTYEYFFRVPQKDGSVAAIRLRSPGADEAVTEAFEAAGGTLL